MLIKIGNFEFTQVWDGVFYKKLGMEKPNDVVVLNKIRWTDFTVE
jgi:hypothetical protein